MNGLFQLPTAIVILLMHSHEHERQIIAQTTYNCPSLLPLRAESYLREWNMSQQLRRPSKILINGVPVDPFERRVADTVGENQQGGQHRVEPLHARSAPASWDPADNCQTRSVESMPARRGESNDRAHRVEHDQRQSVDRDQVPKDHVVIIGANVKVTGDISDCAKCVVYGHVEGSVTASQVIIHREAIIDGSLLAWTAEIRGQLRGDSAVRDVVNARATSSIDGTLIYSRLNLEPGGRISANIRIQDPSWFEQYVTNPRDTAHSSE